MKCLNCDSEGEIRLHQATVLFEEYEVNDEGRVKNWQKTVHEYFGGKDLNFGECNVCGQKYKYSNFREKILLDKPLEFPPEFIAYPEKEDLNWENRKRQ